MLNDTEIVSCLTELVQAAAPRFTEFSGDPMTANLRDAGMTSVAAARLMLEIEAAFDVFIPDDDLTPENFTDLQSIERLIVRLKAAAGA